MPSSQIMENSSQIVETSDVKSKSSKKFDRACYYLYFMQFVQVFFIAPFFVLGALYIANEFTGIKTPMFGGETVKGNLNKPRWKDRYPLFGKPEPTMGSHLFAKEREAIQTNVEMAVLTGGSVDFIAPMITPFIPLYIKEQHAVSMILGLISCILFIITDDGFFETTNCSAFYFLLAGGICSSLANATHIIEMYIRFITPVKIKQTRILENLQVVFILSTIGVLILCTGAYELGNAYFDRKGLMLVGYLAFAVGIMDCFVIYWFFQIVDVDPRKLFVSQPKLDVNAEELLNSDATTTISTSGTTNVAEEAKSLLEKFKKGSRYLSPTIFVVLIGRFLTSANQQVLKIVVVPYLQDSITSLGAVGLLIVGVILSLGYIYYTLDPLHRQPYFWWPYPQCICYLLGSGLLVLFALVEKKNVFEYNEEGVLKGSCKNDEQEECGQGFGLVVQCGVVAICFFLSFVVQAKLTIDRNVMTTDKTLQWTSSWSVILTGIGTMGASAIGPKLKEKLKRKSLYIMGGAFLIMAIFIYIYSKLRAKNVKVKMDKHVEIRKRLFILQKNKFLKSTLRSYREGHPLSWVAKERILSEFNELVPIDDPVWADLDVPDHDFLNSVDELFRKSGDVESLTKSADFEVSSDRISSIKEFKFT
jgi:hypothetical protein